MVAVDLQQIELKEAKTSVQAIINGCREADEVKVFFLTEDYAPLGGEVVCRSVMMQNAFTTETKSPASYSLFLTADSNCLVTRTSWISSGSTCLNRTLQWKDG